MAAGRPIWYCLLLAKTSLQIRPSYHRQGQGDYPPIVGLSSYHVSGPSLHNRCTSIDQILFLPLVSACLFRLLSVIDELL